MAEQRPVIISCDGHATARPNDYIPYIDPAYRERYAEPAARSRAACERRGSSPAARRA